MSTWVSSSRRSFVALFAAAHGGPTLLVTAVASLLALGTERGLGTLWVTAAVLCGQCSVGWSNDWFDRDEDLRAQRSDKALVRGDCSLAVVRACALTALVLCIPLSLASGWRAAAVHFAAIASAWIYNGFMKQSLLSPLPFAISFGLLPAFITLGMATPTWPSWIYMVAAATLGVGAHFLNSLPDLTADQRSGRKGLPQRLGSRLTLWVGVGLVFVSLAMLVVGSRDTFLAIVCGLCGMLALGMVVLTGVRKQERAAWQWTLLTAGDVVVLFVASGRSLVSG